MGVREDSTLTSVIFSAPSLSIFLSHTLSLSLSLFLSLSLSLSLDECVRVMRRDGRQPSSGRTRGGKKRDRGQRGSLHYVRPPGFSLSRTFSLFRWPLSLCLAHTLYFALAFSLCRILSRSTPFTVSIALNLSGVALRAGRSAIGVSEGHYTTCA